LVNTGSGYLVQSRRRLASPGGCLFCHDFGPVLVARQKDDLFGLASIDRGIFPHDS
jgi:hypothetical protein